MIYAVIFSFIAFVLTTLGALLVFFIKKLNGNIIAFLYSISAGIMISSSIFSLIVPAIDYCKELNLKEWIVLPVSFVLGFILILILSSTSKTKKVSARSLTLGVALHNIPEGMCIGFSFASIAHFSTQAALTSAIMVSLGIGIQNIPEGSSVAFPLHSIGYSKKRAFFTSVLVGLVEVPAGIIAYALGLKFLFLLPYMLSFAAAIMIFVACQDLVVEASLKSKKISNIGFILGFMIMTLLDVLLG